MRKDIFIQLLPVSPDKFRWYNFKMVSSGSSSLHTILRCLFPQSLLWVKSNYFKAFKGEGKKLEMLNELMHFYSTDILDNLSMFGTMSFRDFRELITILQTLKSSKDWRFYVYISANILRMSSPSIKNSGSYWFFFIVFMFWQRYILKFVIYPLPKYDCILENCCR